MHNMHLIINTHWDREYRWSFSETQMRLVEAVDDLIDIMNRDEGFAYFHTDSQVSMLDDYLEARPERTAELKKLVAEGRILTGPWYTLPAEFLVSGEALVRNLLMGHKIAGKLGKVMKAGYNIFSWGQVSQLPQIYSQFGMDAIIFYRGIDQSRLKTLEFKWDAPDGTQVLGLTFGAYHRLNFWRYVYLPYILGGDCVSGDHHGIGRNNLGDAYMAHLSDDAIDMVNHNVYSQQCVRDLPSAIKGLDELIDTVKEKSSVEDLLFLQGFDQENPDPVITELLQRLNDRPDAGKITVSNLEEYIATVKEKLETRHIMETLPVLTGEMLEVERVGDAFGPLYNGVFSARMPIKILNSACEALLAGRAEPAAVWEMVDGEEYPAVAMEKAWKELLKNQQHDGIGGCHVDRVTETMNERYATVKDIGETIVKNKLCALAGKINFSGLKENEIGLVIANTGFTPRSDIVICTVDIPKDWGMRWSGSSRRDFHLSAVDQDGNEIPCHILTMNDDTVFGYLKFGNVIGYETTRCRIALQADNVPANGYASYFITPHKLRQGVQNTIATGALSMENDFLSVRINENGTLRITEKNTGKTFDRVHYFEDNSDKGGPLKFDPAYQEGRMDTLSQRPEISLISNSDLTATYRITYQWDLPESICTDLRIHVPHGSEWVDQGSLHRSDRRKTITIRTEVTLRKGAAAVEFETVLDNTVRDHRLRVLFPTGMENVDTVLADSPFDLVARAIPVPDSTGWYEESARTWPSKSLVSMADDSLRCSVFHSGLSEYEVTEDRDRSIAMTLLRCFSTAGNPTETFRYQELAQCQGTHRFRYSFNLNETTINSASIVNRALAWNIPLHAVQTTPHKGTAPLKKSFVTVSDESFVVTCMKKAEYEDAILLRGYYESAGTTELTFNFDFQIGSVRKVTLEEVVINSLPVDHNRVTLPVRGKEILSLLVTLA